MTVPNHHPKEASDYGSGNYIMLPVNARLRAMTEFLIGVWKSFLMSLDLAGIKASVFAWGFVGGFVNAMITPGTLSYRILTGFVGMASSVLFGPIMAHMADWFIPDQWNVFYADLLSPSGFICGLAGMTFVKGILAMADHAADGGTAVVKKWMK